MPSLRARRKAGVAIQEGWIATAFGLAMTGQ